VSKDSGQTQREKLTKVTKGVALTERKTTGPPCSVTVELWLDCRRHARVKPPAGPPWSVTDDRRRQTPATVTSLAPYTMCRLASNNKTLLVRQTHMTELLSEWLT